MSDIHPTAIVSPQASIGADVSVGPFAIVEAGASIGDGCCLAARAVVKDGVDLGSDNTIAEGVVLGGRPQHLKATGPVGILKIGARNTIREHVTIHRGLKAGQQTRIGNDNLLMVGSHIAHDCILGDGVVVANNTMLAGHVIVGDRAYISGAVGVHQFCRIGSLAMVGGQAHVAQDVPPFVNVDGKSSFVVGLNLIGLRRAGFGGAEVNRLKAAYRLLYHGRDSWETTLARLEREFTEGLAKTLWSFVAVTKRGIIQERRGPRLSTVGHPPAQSPQPSAEGGKRMAG